MFYTAASLMCSLLSNLKATPPNVGGNKLAHNNFFPIRLSLIIGFLFLIALLISYVDVR